MVRSPLYLVCWCALCLWLTACGQNNESTDTTSEHNTNINAAPEAPLKGEPPKPISTANAVAKLNRAISKTLHHKRVPDFSQYTDVKQKKHAFFNFLRPLAEQANAQVLRLREELSHINPQRITKRQAQRLAQLARTYKINTTDASEQLQLLLRKVQTIPASLILAQAANESAWGTSRFAQQGNNLFGQWCFKPGCGLVPKSRPVNASYEVRLFETPLESVSAYIRNLNSHGGYLNLRRIRECMQAENESVTGRALASGLLHYSSRGVDYINDIKQLIRVNKLEPWEQNWWGEQQAQHACYNLVQIPSQVAKPYAPKTTQLAATTARGK